MSTAKAIRCLREKLGLNQRQFAKLLGVTPYSISRYENGREPASHLLAKLTDVAKESGAEHLHDLFQAKRRSDIAVQVENLSSSGSARRIPVWEVNYLANALEILSKEGNVRVARKALEVLSPYLYGEK
jgi:transcriptional regulator with XRE-family HTH domain